MIDVNSEEYIQICSLYDNGKYIESLKKQCNMIIKYKCSADILIDYRKKLYSIYITGDNGMDDDVIIMFKYAIVKCTLNNEKYNIPFIKKAIGYLEQKNNVDYNLINEWLNYYNVSLLNTEIYGNNKYSDKELYYLKKAKTLDEIKKIEELKKLLDVYCKEKNQNGEIVFFIEYHICKLLFTISSFEDANEYLKKLLRKKREKYILGLPIKYHDYTNEREKLLYILELLIDGQTADYLYAYIINWLKKSKYTNIVHSIESDYLLESNNYTINNYRKFKKDIITNICAEKDVADMIKIGKIVKITKSGNGFLSDENDTFFINKRYLNKETKKGLSFKYFLVEKYNQEKNTILKEAVIINRRYLDEILCSKKGD